MADDVSYLIAGAADNGAIPFTSTIMSLTLGVTLSKSESYKHAECCIDDCFFIDLIDDQKCWGQISIVTKENLNSNGKSKYHLCQGHIEMKICYSKEVGCDFWDLDKSKYIEEQE